MCNIYLFYLSICVGVISIKNRIYSHSMIV